MTASEPASRPLVPALTRMALGLLLVTTGGLVTWRGVELKPIPGLQEDRTTFEIPLDGPLPLDLAKAAWLNFEGNRTNITLDPLPSGTPHLLQGNAKHRAQNKLSVGTHRQGSTLNSTIKLYVKNLDAAVVVPEPFQHYLTAHLSPDLPLTLSTSTVGGNQRLDLRTLRIHKFSARSDSGDQTLTIPAKKGGPYALVTRSGQITVHAQPGAAPEALRVNAQTGDLILKLSQSRLEALNAGTQSGDMSLWLPQRVNRGSLTTISGDVNVRAEPGSSGNLDIRTQSGDVTLTVPPQLITRIRFTDRETIVLPRGTPDATPPQLDLFVDTSSGQFTLNGEPDPDAAPPQLPSPSAPDSSRSTP